MLNNLRPDTKSKPYVDRARRERQQRWRDRNRIARKDAPVLAARVAELEALLTHHGITA